MPTKAAPSLREEQSAEAAHSSISRREWLLIIAGWLLGTLLLFSLTQIQYLLSRDKALSYREGQRVSDDYILSADFTYIDKQATEKVVSLNRSLVPPVYDVHSEITDSVLERFDLFAALIVQPGVSRELHVQFPGMSGLLEQNTARNIKVLKKLLPLTRSALQDVQYAGLFRLDAGDGGAASGLIEVNYAGKVSARRISLIRDAVYQPENLADRVREMDLLGQLSSSDIEFVTALTVYFSEVNGFLNSFETEKSRDQAAMTTEPVEVFLPAGTGLLHKGDIVTSRDVHILEALSEGRDWDLHSLVDPLLFLALIIAVGLISAHTFGISLRNRKTRNLAVILAGSYIFVASLLVVFVPFRSNLSVSAVMPTALFTLLLAQLLQDRKMAVLASILMTLFIYFLTDENGYDTILTLAGAMAGTLAVRRRENRMGLLRSGPRLAAIIAVSSLCAGVLFSMEWKRILIMSGYGVLNGLLTGILSLAFLPLLEHVLNTATTFRLIELSDMNVPLLKRMRLQAPGTFIHSQNVAHMAEAACDAIGADGLLARVGSYYHDIGKVDQASFFVENQSGENRHDDLKPSLSAAVIKSHVKIGMEKGRELHLPDEVLAFIEQHHGTSIIKYFYDRACREKGKDAVNPDDFSYPGPKPQTRETAVVMLADNAEAATRTLKKPTAAKLEKYVWDLIMDRLKSGELNESDITLKELEIVKNSFVHVLTGHFHTRIEYPGDSDNA